MGTSVSPWRMVNEMLPLFVLQEGGAVQLTPMKPMLKALKLSA